MSSPAAVRLTVVIFALAALAGCGSGSEAHDDESLTAAATPSTAATPEPIAAAQHFLGCADVVSTTSGLRFVVAGPLHNVGDVPLRLRATIRWQLRGRDLTAQRTFRVRPGQRRRVRFTVLVTEDTVQRFDATGGRCSAGVTAVGRDAHVTTAP